MISLIIPTFNEEKYLPFLLESIKKQDFEGDFEVIVSDNNSTDKTLKIAKDFDCKITEGGSPPEARNKGAKQAKRNILLFIDADIVLPEDFLSKSLSEFKEKNLDVAGFFLSPKEGGWVLKAGYAFFYNFLACFLGGSILPHATSIIMAKKGLHSKIKGFDESVSFGEDSFYAREGSKIGKFGIVSSSFAYVSTRRFKRDGLFKTVLKYILCEIHMILFGPVRSNTFNYNFGYKVKRSKLIRVFEEIVFFSIILILFPLFIVVYLFSLIFLVKRSKSRNS
jgi:glycosyltransferase involved in cell wall biosynthesis